MKKAYETVGKLIFALVAIVILGMNCIQSNKIITYLEEAKAAETEKEEEVEAIAATLKDLYLCPYCNCGLTISSSSGETSVAQLKCSYCEFCTPAVRINEPDAELKCIKKCKENFKNNTWTDEDFTGEKMFN